MTAGRRRDLIRRMLSPSVPLTARVIEQRLRAAGHDVTRRTLERDLRELLDVGEAVGDGCKPRGFRRGASHAVSLRRELDPAEAVVFQLAEAHLRQLLPAGFNENFGALFRQARETPMRGLAASGGVSAMARWATKVRALPDGVPRVLPRIRPLIHEAVSDALLRERRLHVLYWVRYRNETTEHWVSPLGIFQLGVFTYLVVFSERNGHVFTLSLQRVWRAEVLDEPARRPPGFNLDAWIASPERQFGSKGDIDLVLLVSAVAVPPIQEAPLAHDQRLTLEADGSWRLEVRLPWTPPLERWILGMGDAAEVLEPTALRDEIARRVSAAAARYRGTS